MTHKTNRYGIYEVDRTKFGGIIYPSDFNTDYRRKDNTYGSSIAQRIISDRKFDHQCRKNIEERNKKQTELINVYKKNMEEIIYDQRNFKTSNETNS